MGAGGIGIAWAVLHAAVLLALVLALWLLAWRPRAIAMSLARQGVRGPPYRFLVGSAPEARRLVRAGRRGAPPLDAGSHDIMPHVLPQFHAWVAQYGKTFLCWTGPIPTIFSTDLQLIKQVLTDRTGLFPKDYLIPVLKTFFGNGILLINGDDWKRHRKVVLPAFHHEKTKIMLAVAAELAEKMTQRWRGQIEQLGGGVKGARIDMNHAFYDLTAEINGRFTFGTSHRQVEEVVSLMRELQNLSTAASLDAPILWYLPTRLNLRVRRLDRQVRTKIMAIMQARVDASKRGGDGKNGYGDDLLGLLLEASSPGRRRAGGGQGLTTQEAIDEVKTFFAAAQDTLAALLVWTMFLLAVHPQWQEKVREEVLRECGGGIPDSEALAKLKQLQMVLLEASRLYTPILYTQRRAASDVVLGGIEVPRGTVVAIPIGMLHRDKEVWGPDADEFNPERFRNGVTRAASDPKALLSFSLGPRVCAGQSLSVTEAQIVLATIIRKFSFVLSPDYVHKPRFLLSTLAPNKLGMPLILKNLDA